MVQESLIHALKEEGIEEIAADGEFDHNYHMAIQTLPADDEHPADHHRTSLPKRLQTP